MANGRAVQIFKEGASSAAAPRSLCFTGSSGRPRRAPPRRQPLAHLAAFHVFHVHGVLHAFAFLLLVLLLLAEALLADAEAAGEEQEAGDHSNGDQRPGGYCPQREGPGSQRCSVMQPPAPDMGPNGWRL